MKKYEELLSKIENKKETIGVIGCGYIGMELIKNFAPHCKKIIGFDIDEEKVIMHSIKSECITLHYGFEVTVIPITYTADFSKLTECDVVLIACPTPVLDKAPYLNPIKKAIENIWLYVESPVLIVIESSVPIGFTREVQKTIKEEINIEFFIGFSPERIMPGDTEHTMENTPKIISGYDGFSVNLIRALYSKVCRKIIEADEMEEAEAAKLIENTQRDVNIAFMNECAMNLGEKGINHCNVFDLCGTHWNFKQYTAGLVGGTCIPVNPYYLWYKIGIINILKSARIVNDSMIGYVSRKILSMAGELENKKILVMGGTYKSNVKSMANSKILDLVEGLKGWPYNANKIDLYEPMCDLDYIDKTGYDIVIIGTKSKWIEDKINDIEGIWRFYKKGIEKKDRILIDLCGFYISNRFKPAKYWRL